MKKPVRWCRAAVNERCRPCSPVPMRLALVALATLSCESSTQRPRMYTFELDLGGIIRDSVWVPAMKELLDMPAPPADWRPFAPYQLRPPADDAPEEILMAWWSRSYLGEPHDEPSEVATRRILDAFERYPEMWRRLLFRLPRTPEVYGRVREVLARENRRPEARLSTAQLADLETLVDRLAPRSLAELREAVRTAHYSPNSSHVMGTEEVAALLERHPRQAVRLLDQLAAGSDRIVATWAMAHHLTHAVATGDHRRARELRHELRAIAVDTAVEPFARNEAIYALAGHHWPERDEWLMSLFLDPTLAALRQGAFLMSPLQAAVSGDPESLAPRVLTLLGHSQDHVHNLAVRSLAAVIENGKAGTDNMRALLPWLENPGWARSNTAFEEFARRWYIEALGKVIIPEAVPGLVHVARTASVPWDRMRAAVVLAVAYPSRDIVPVLREAIEGELFARHRMAIVRALAAVGDLSAGEMLSAVRLYALLRSTREGREILASLQATDHRPTPGGTSITKVHIGMLAVNEFSRLPSGVASELAGEIFAAADHVEMQSHPVMALELRRIAASWRHPLVRSQILADMKRGKVYSEVIRETLAQRAWYAKTGGDELGRLIARGGHVAGLAAIMLGDEAVVDEIVSGQDEDARVAALAAARLIRQPIAVATVAPHLASTSEMVALAAERYLEALDSPAARTTLHAHHAGQLLVLGARERFEPVQETADAFDVHERSLIERITGDETLREIHALLGFTESAGSSILAIIEIRADGARLVRGSTERELDDEELGRWLALIAEQRVLDLPPLISEARTRTIEPLDFSSHHVVTHEPTQYQFLHLTRERGRRVFMTNPGDHDWASPYHLLWLNFQRLR